MVLRDRGKENGSDSLMGTRFPFRVMKLFGTI